MNKSQDKSHQNRKKRKIHREQKQERQKKVPLPHSIPRCSYWVRSFSKDVFKKWVPAITRAWHLDAGNSSQNLNSIFGVVRVEWAEHSRLWTGHQKIARGV